MQAAILSENVSRTYELKADRVHVSETITMTITDSRYLVPAGQDELFVVFNPITEDPQAQERVDKTLPTIQVFNSAGQGISFDTKQDGQNIKILVTRGTALTYNHPQTFRVEYDSFALSSKVGAVYDMYLPSFSSQYPFDDGTTTRSIATIARIPKNFGQINFIAPQKQPADGGDFWQLDFTHQELTDVVSWIQIGTTQYYQFEINQPYQATSSLPLLRNSLTILLPRDVDSGPLRQQVWFSEVYPAPSSVELDDLGNLVAHFSMPANQSGNISIKGYIQVDNNRDVDITQAGSLQDIPADILGKYTTAGQFWEADDPIIKQTALDIKGDLTDVYQILSKAYAFVVDKIDYSDVKRFGLNERQGALATLQGGSAVCMEYSDLFIALLRGAGVPARAAFGYGYDLRATAGLDTAHQWAEVYLPKLDTWVMVDTTWGESGSAVIGADLNHFYKYVAAIDPLTPAPVSARFIGSLGDIADEQFAITALETPPQQEQMNEQQLLDKYPSSSGIATWTQGLVTTAQDINANINQVFTSLGISASLSPFVKIAALITVILGISALIWRKRKQQRRQHV